MTRTQVYLSREDLRLLKTLARQRRTTMSELIRQAVEATYGLPGPEEFARVLQQVAGIWANRPEFADPERYVRQLRQGRRLRRLWGKRR